MNQKIPLEHHNLLFVHSEGLGDLITFRNHYKSVICYCHTPLKIVNDPFAMDQYIKRNPKKALLLNIFGKVFQKIDLLAWKNYTHVFATSKTVKSRILKAKLCNEKIIEILQPGVDCTVMTPSWSYKKYFLLLTRIKWWKNVELAIEGFKKFRQCNLDLHDYEMIIAGQVDNGSTQYFQSLLEQSKYCNSIKFITNPSVEEARLLLSSCYAALNTTQNEDWGMVPLEANAYGKPVIAVNRGGPTESQVDGVTGYLVAPEPNAFARAMALLAKNEELVWEMGKAARQNALKYDWSAVVEKLDKILYKFITI